MQSTYRSSEGKGRAEEGDYKNSLASLSLSDYRDHHARRKKSYKSSYPDVYGSSYEQPYAGDDQYGWTAQGSQSSSAANSGTPGYSSSYPTTSTKPSMGGSKYRSEPSASSPSGYAKYGSASVSRRVPSSYGEGPVSNWRLARRTAVPSAHLKYGDRTDVNSINRQRPANKRYQLPCEFHSLTGCDRVFAGDDEQAWMQHVEGHLQSIFPTRLRCWFCTDQRFDARETSGGDVRSNFITRMGHIRDHFVYDGFRRDQARNDGYLVQHLFDRNIIDKRTYESIINPTAPPISAGRRGRGSRLPQVEEKVVAKSGSRHHHRSEHKREQNREPSVAQHTSRRGLQDPVAHSKLHPAPAVDSVHVAVTKTPVQDRSSPYSSSMMLENTSVAGSRISRSTAASRRPASKHSCDQSIALVGDETATDTVVNASHILNVGHVGEASSDSPGRVQPLQSEDRPNVVSPSYSTDASTPESGSIWLAEYSEDEDNKLDEDHPFHQHGALAVARVFEAFHSWRESYSEQDTICDGVEESNPTQNKDKGKGKDSETGKRKRATQSETNKSKDNSNGPSSNRVGCSKRIRTHDRQLTFACPYTKKDPMSYRVCYRYKLSRIRDVKQHLVRCHRNPPYCPRCMDTFETEEERDEHVRDSSCPLQPSFRLDGITDSQRSQLAKKSASNTSPEAQWFAVFEIVFPGHSPRPLSPYVDSELLQDITLYQDFLTSHGPRILSRVLDEQGVVTWHLPNEERDLAAFQQEVLEEGLGTIFDQWLARRGSSSQDSNETSSSGHNTPPSSFNSGEMVGSTSFHNSRAVTSESSGSRPGGQRAGAYHDTEHVQGALSDQISSSEVLDGSYSLEHGNSDFLSGLTYDGSDDELTRFFMDG